MSNEVFACTNRSSGVQAAVLNYPLIMRHKARYDICFPKVKEICL
jgi:hypothetical protein